MDMDITCCIEITLYAWNTTKDCIFYYFENTRRSGGGIIKRLEKIEEKYIVCFEDPKVIPNVLGRNHVLDDQKLMVQKYAETAINNRIIQDNSNNNNLAETNFSKGLAINENLNNCEKSLSPRKNRRKGRFLPLDINVDNYSYQTVITNIKSYGKVESTQSDYKMQNATYDEYGQTVHEDTEQTTGCKQPTKIKMVSDQDINGNDTSKITENKACKEHQTKNNDEDVSPVVEVEIDKNENKHSKKRRKRLKRSTNECAKIIQKVSNRPDFLDLKKKRIQLIKAHKFDLIKGKKVREIRDCTYLSNGSVVFADYANSSLIFYDENNAFKREKSIKGGVMFVTNLGTDTIAVSLLQLQEILIIGTINMKIKKRIVFNEEVIQGVEGIDGNMIVRVCGLGYKIFGTDGSWIRTIKHDGNNMPYIAGSEDAIYYTNWETHIVGCINSNGVKTFVFSKEGFMAPNGVAVDKNGYVYVLGSHSHNVVVFAKDFATTNCHQFFEIEMKYPMAVDCCKNNDQIIICSIRGNVSVFQTKHE